MAVELEQDIVISDGEIDDINKLIENFSKYHSDKIEAYLSILDNIILNGIPEGIIHDNLLLFKDAAQELSGEVEELLSALISSNIQMIKDLDEADDYLF